MTELLFIVTEDESGGYSARAVGTGIFTQGDSKNDLLRNLREAVRCHFDDTEDAPKVAHLHFVHDETVPIEGTDEESITFPLPGPYRFDDPFSPVGLEDWEALK
jgi:predicted RNase H-like HicB family nuclease